MLETALQIEEKGRAFYDRAQRSCGNSECREIFSALMKDEVLHQGRIKKIHDELTADQPWTRNWESLGNSPDKKEVEALFRKLVREKKMDPKPEATDLEALNTGLALEEASLSFYQEHLSKTTDPLEAAFLEQMIREERGHWRSLQDIRFYLTDPQGWFMEKEKAGLDGV